MPFSQLPALLSGLLAPIAAALERRSAPRLLRLLAGALFARGRRTVTSWSRAAGITTDFRRAYCALWAAGRRAENLAFRLLRGPLAPLLALAPATTCCSRWTTPPPPATAPACRAPASGSESRLACSPRPRRCHQGAGSG